MLIGVWSWSLKNPGCSGDLSNEVIWRCPMIVSKVGILLLCRNFILRKVSISRSSHVDWCLVVDPKEPWA